MVGMVFAKDVLKALHQGKHDTPLAEVVREARYVPESKKVADLLREMQREKFHMALVTDEYGSVTGLVSLEDLLEELVGEITDEYDREEPEFVQVGDGVFRVSGKASIDDVNELLRGRAPDEEWDTVAGLVLDCFGRIPDEGEECRFDGLTFRAEEVQGRRIAKRADHARAPSPRPALVEDRADDLDRARRHLDELVAAAREARANAYAPVQRVPRGRGAPRRRPTSSSA